jgi:hypothetical protein
MRCNRREIPQEFLPPSKKEKYSRISGFTDNTGLVSYVPKKKEKCERAIHRDYGSNIAESAKLQNRI